MSLHVLLKRLLSALPVLWAVSTIVFLLLHLIPGDPVDLMLGENALPADRAELTQALHLNEPLSLQYVRFMGGLAHGDLGRSLYDARPVSTHLRERFGATMLLALAAFTVCLAIAIPAGVVAAVRRGFLWDRLAMLLALMGISIPNFWLGPVLVLIFSVHLGWFPVEGRGSLPSLFLPAITLGSGLAAMLSRLTRSSMLEELASDYVTTARAKGMSELRVIVWHALRNALNPVITVVGLQVGTLLAGTIITEKIFSWPGIGTLLLDSIHRRDYPVVQGCVLTIAFTYVLVGVATDLLYRAADPRVKLS